MSTPYVNTCRYCFKPYSAWMPPNVSFFCSMKCQQRNSKENGPIRRAGPLRYATQVETVEALACAWAFDLGVELAAPKKGEGT